MASRLQLQDYVLSLEETLENLEREQKKRKVADDKMDDKMADKDKPPRTTMADDKMTLKVKNAKTTIAEDKMGDKVKTPTTTMADDKMAGKVKNPTTPMPMADKMADKVKNPTTPMADDEVAEKDKKPACQSPWVAFGILSGAIQAPVASVPESVICMHHILARCVVSVYGKLRHSNCSQKQSKAQPWKKQQWMYGVWLYLIFPKTIRQSKI